MDKSEREKYRKDAETAIQDGGLDCAGVYAGEIKIRGIKLVALLNHIDALEGQINAKPSAYLVRKEYAKWDETGTVRTGETYINEHVEHTEADAIFYRDALGFEITPLVAIASAQEGN
jgi:hypothetical protein